MSEKMPRIGDLKPYARARLSFLLRTQQDLYAEMLIDGTLMEHLNQVQETCELMEQQAMDAKQQELQKTELWGHDILACAGLIENARQTAKQQAMREIVMPEPVDEFSSYISL